MTTNTAGEPSAVGQYGPFAVAVVGISLIVYPITFNLGAYGVVFYEDVLAFVVAGTAGLGVSVLASPYSGWRLRFTTVALGAPAAWLLLAVVITDSTAAAATDPVLGTLLLLVAGVSIPTVLRMLLDLYMPDIWSNTDRRLLLGGLAVIVAIAAAGWFMGYHHDRFLTCDDFKVAGSDQPEDCARL